ncbi:MAG: uracil-DNA glycosylase [Acidimicrobiales bacterium]|nr:uracil-DNA glycosylase [Acidimicrobiales bacterium]
MDSLERLRGDVVACRACPRLVAWRERVAAERRAAFRTCEYWGRPVPGFGDPHARVLLVGLAPAAHGANRTGRMFTGDRSGDWLYRSLHRVGLATSATSTGRDDGLELRGAYVTAAVRCAPPANAPTPAERRACLGFLERERSLLPDVRVVVCLGQLAYATVAALLIVRPRPRPLPRFGHGVEAVAPDGVVVLCSYHPSQQNTFTGRLTEPMLDAVMARAVELAGPGVPWP